MGALREIINWIGLLTLTFIAFGAAIAIFLAPFVIASQASQALGYHGPHVVTVLLVAAVGAIIWGTAAGLLAHLFSARPTQKDR